MTQPESDRHAHWESVYGSKAPDQVSWFQARPDVSLDLINKLDLGVEASILDVGGGASTLVDYLLAEGRTSLAVLDLSEAALAHARTRLRDKSGRVSWIAADVTSWMPEAAVDVWHDRAVLHFLTDQSDREGYARALHSALKPGGWAIIAGFAPGGPQKCSGLDIVQHDADSLQALLGEEFALTRTRDDVHRTPWGAEQSFRYHCFRRLSTNDANAELDLPQLGL